MTQIRGRKLFKFVHLRDLFGNVSTSIGRPRLPRTHWALTWAV